MSRDARVQAGSLYDKVLRLEDQVKGLMETVNTLIEASHLDNATKIPKPDQYVPAGGYTIGDLYDRMPTIARAADAARAAAASSAGTKTAPKAEMKPSPPIATSEIHSRLPEPPLPPLPPYKFSPWGAGFTTSEIQSLPPYKYSPLSAGSSEIRLLALQRSTSPTESILCRLFKVSLNDAPKFSSSTNPLPISVYTPLSYCWGTISGMKPIIIDRQSFHVTPSLYSALQHFRGTRQEGDSETYWWIDAICINQGDLDERSSQIGLMTQLYKQAQMVHVWLGEESEDSARAMQLIRDLAYLPRTAEESGNWSYIPKPGQTHRPDGPGRPMVKLPTEPAPIPVEEKLKNYKALINLYQRPWFSRVWIRQEVALPRNVKFHCGAETCTWGAVMRTAHILAFLADEYHLPALQGELRRDGLFKSCFQNAEVLRSISRDMVNGTKYLKLDALVLKSRDCQATDPRDKVYAMLPLTNPDETDIVADYRKHHLEVYKTTALCLIKTNIDYLSGCQLTSRSNGLPSWVPNLESPWDASQVQGRHRTDLEKMGTDLGSPKFTYSPEHSRLDVRGVIFDTIRTINHEYYITPALSNADALAATSQWKEFYTSERQKLYASWENEGGMRYYEKREQCDRMLGTSDVLRSWEFYVLQNTSKISYGGLPYWTQHGEHPNVDQDPVMKKLRRLLPSEPSPFSELLNKDNNLGALRRSAVGRRFITTSKGGMALAPIAAEAGDHICFFDGSGIPFIIRKASDDTWVIVGTAYFFQCIELYFGTQPKLHKSIISLV